MVVLAKNPIPTTLWMIWLNPVPSCWHYISFPLYITTHIHYIYYIYLVHYYFENTQRNGYRVTSTCDATTIDLIISSIVCIKKPKLKSLVVPSTSIAPKANQQWCSMHEKQGHATKMYPTLSNLKNILNTPLSATHTGDTLRGSMPTTLVIPNTKTKTKTLCKIHACTICSHMLYYTHRCFELP